MPRRSARLAAQADDAVEGVAAISVAESGGGSGDETETRAGGTTTIGKRFDLIFEEEQPSGEKPATGIKAPAPPLPTLDIIPYERWVSCGYGDQEAQRMVYLQQQMKTAVDAVNTAASIPRRRPRVPRAPIRNRVENVRRSGLVSDDRVLTCSIRPTGSTAMSGRDLRRIVQPHDRHLLKFWTALSDSLKHYEGNHECVNFRVWSTALDASVLKILSPGVTSVKLSSLSFVGNALEGSSFSLVADIICQLPTLKAFTMCHNNIGGQKDDVIKRFSAAILSLPNLTSLTLGSVGMGNNKTLLSCVRNKELQTVNLGSNSISSEGAYFLAKCIANSDAKGRRVTRVALDGNDFGDKGAMLFASALKVNKTLARLDLQRNKISCEGKKVLFKALYDDSSLNALSESNHTCHVEVEDRTGETPRGNCKRPHIEFINNHRVPKYCGRKSKIVAKMYAPSSDGGSSLRYFEDVPVELMPEALELIQYGSFISTRSQTHTLLFDILQAKPLIFVAKNTSKAVICRKRKAL